MRKILALALFVLAAWAGEFKVEKSFPVKEGVLLCGKVTAGEVKIKAWDKLQVKVYMEIKYKGEKPEAEVYREDNEVHFKVRSKNRFCLFSCGNNAYYAKVEVMVPRNYSLDLHTVSGKLSVQGGELEEAEIHTVSGRVVLENVSAERLFLKTVSGSIRASGDRAGKVYASTVSGDLSFSFSYLGRAKLSSVSGDIKLEGKSSQKWCTSSVSGDLILKPLSKVCYMKLSSTSGDVEVDGMSINGKVEKRNCEEGLHIKAKTVSGDIILEVQH